LNLGLLLGALKSKLGFVGWKSIAWSVCRSLLCSLAMGIVVWGVALVMLPDKTDSLPSLLGGVIGSILVGLFTYGVCSYVLKSPELHSVFVEVRKGVDK
jgi:peptidoglycan biosynthesis protein MviN/MurJ (putative lipid II flippase)